MRKLFAALFVLVLFSAPAYSQIQLKLEDCVSNETHDGGGYCAWCCIETLGRHHKIKSLYGLKDKRSYESDFKTWDAKNKKWIIEPYVWVDHGNYKEKVHRGPGDYTAMKQKLDAANVKYRIQETGIFKTDIIKYAVKDKFGCMIVVNNWSGNSPTVPHAVCIQDYDDDKLVIFDPNDLEHNYHITWNWFRSHWTGYVLVVEGSK
jgi:hypothetical protein